MLSLLGQIVVNHHYNFLGIEGFAGIVLGIILVILICVVLFKLIPLIAAKCGADATTQQIIYWLMVLVVIVMFLHWFGLY